MSLYSKILQIQEYASYASTEYGIFMYYELIGEHLRAFLPTSGNFKDEFSFGGDVQDTCFWYTSNRICIFIWTLS